MDSTSQLSHEVQRLSKAKIDLEEKYQSSQDRVSNLEKHVA